MMGKLPLGVVSPYVKMSSGGCTDPLKFYATSYCTAYGREEFKPRTGSHVGTGYKSNYRPVISYQASLDALDNPAMGEQVRDNFQTVTSQSYRPLEVPDGKYPLPWNMHQTSSGYAHERPNAGPPTKEVRKVHFDTQEHGPQAITGLERREVPLLHQLQGKGSLEWENSRYVSGVSGSQLRAGGWAQGPHPHAPPPGDKYCADSPKKPTKCGLKKDWETKGFDT
ncbi:PREDICTED: protein phosphatase 1 regulatory subunit 32-like [Galeopterus variegatus]|uniref:Protein phosphatase 1 regulatory subunit 32-like n=1 Tax=Galeopterus variegatus TaxID=482537 RepID=A0ABM0Q000_GALVR|nr:PREDICTED: protein phosphatase 1 regulatory subunit 32-like [Galeopterus variegatus]